MHQTRIHWKNLSSEPEVDAHVRVRCEELAAEFPETERYELSLSPGGLGLVCHGHVSGKKTRVAAHCRDMDSARKAADSTINKIERELRRSHDKRIFSLRRRARGAKHRVDDQPPE